MTHRPDSDNDSPSAFEAVADGGTPIEISRDHYPEPSRFRRELKRADAAYGELRKAAETVIGGVRVGRQLDPTPLKKPLEAVVASVIRHPDAMVWMRKLDNQHSFLIGHAVRTAALAIVLARDMGLSEVRLERAGMAALMCPLGKTKLPRGLLEQPGPLNDKDRARVQGFIETSVEILRDCPVIGEDVVAVVRSHHERFDGSGYPQGLKGDAIPVLARLVGVADYYDAATTRKPYTDRVLSATEAMDHLYRARGLLFQAQVVEEFIRAMGIYPSGNLVELSTGEVALIEAQNLDHRTQPRILVVLEPDGRPLKTPTRVDLLSHNRSALEMPLTINRVLAAGELDLDPNEIMQRASDQRSAWRRLLGG